MKIYLRLLTQDSRLKLEEVNDATFQRRSAALADDGTKRFIDDQYVKVDGSGAEITLKGIATAEIGWVARLMNATIPTGTNQDFIRPLGPVRFKSRKSTILITPNGEVFKRT